MKAIVYRLSEYVNVCGIEGGHHLPHSEKNEDSLGIVTQFTKEKIMVTWSIKIQEISAFYNMPTVTFSAS